MGLKLGMKKISISTLKKNLFLKDLVEAMKQMSVDDDGDLIEKIFLNCYSIVYPKFGIIADELDDYEKIELEDGGEEQFILGQFRKKIKNFTEFEILLHRSFFEGTLLNKISDNFSLIYYFEFKTECHYLVFFKI